MLDGGGPRDPHIFLLATAFIAYLFRYTHYMVAIITVPETARELLPLILQYPSNVYFIVTFLAIRSIVGGHISRFMAAMGIEFSNGDYMSIHTLFAIAVEV